jgi:hypothetical protein
MTMYGCPASVWPVSMIETMWGWFETATVASSSFSTESAVVMSSSTRRTLTATVRSSRSWTAV